MVVPDTEMICRGEVESPSHGDQHPKNHPLSTLGRQSSIYSLTLDEFQHTLCENGKNFGSMNMDEFLTSIWTAEENQATFHSANTNTNTNTNNDNANSNANLSLSEAEKWIVKQPSLSRQGSLTLPAPLCSKTVDEVWSEIHSVQQENDDINNTKNVQNPESAPRQPTFGEMTLEDFLIKAGVVQEQCTELVPAHQQQQQQQYGMYQNNNPAVGPSFVNRPIMGGSGSGGGGGAGVATYQTMPQSNVAIGESSGYAGNGKRNSGYRPRAAGACYGGGAYGPPQPMALAAPVSPVSSDGMCTSQVDNSGSQFGSEMGGLRGRKRIIDGPGEKVVERRQRRMIKNRESAARSRARKQAYTVELEAELNQLKDENAHLRQSLNELERKRKQQELNMESSNQCPKSRRETESDEKKLELAVVKQAECYCMDANGLLT